jgi:hypothetical protein
MCHNIIEERRQEEGQSTSMNRNRKKRGDAPQKMTSLRIFLRRQMVRMMIDFTPFQIPGSALCDADLNQELKSVSGCGMQDWVAR